MMKLLIQRNSIIGIFRLVNSIPISNAQKKKEKLVTHILVGPPLLYSFINVPRFPDNPSNLTSQGAGMAIVVFG